ncbi:MAG: sugar kinase [Streptosporangiales bacterium]
MTDFVTLGETLALLANPTAGPLRHAPELRLGVAGAESNVAVGVRRLGHTASWLGRVGDDEMGRLVLARIRGEDIEVRAQLDPDAPTGLMLKEHRFAGLSRVVYYRAGSAGSRFSPADLDEQVIAGARVLHLTGITPALSATAREAVWAAIDIARKADATICLDYNYRSALWDPAAAGRELRDLTKVADVVFAGEDEGQLVTGECSADAVARSLAALGPAEVIIKQGADGALAWVDDTLIDVSAVPVQAVDPVGAGDAFVAGYLSARLDGADTRTRLREATLAGAFAVTVHGDWEGLPERREMALLEQTGGTVLR